MDNVPLLGRRHIFPVKQIMDVPTFTLNVEVQLNHCLRAQMIKSAKGCHNLDQYPVALAIKDKLAELSIPFAEVHCIRDPIERKYKSTIGSIPFNGKRYSYEADHSPDFGEQLYHFLTDEISRLTFQLEFSPVEELKPVEAPLRQLYFRCVGSRLTKLWKPSVKLLHKNVESREG